MYNKNLNTLSISKKQDIKISRKSFKYLLINSILMYPLLNILLAYINRADGLATFHLIYYFYLISIYSISYWSKKVKIEYVILAAYLCLLIGAQSFFISQFSIDLLDFVYTISFFIIFSDERIQDDFLEYISKHYKKINIICVLYLFILLLSVIRGDGISSGWGTTSLSGPYLLNHILSYELIILLMLLIVVADKRKNIISFIGILIFIGLIIATAVRSALIATIVCLLYYFYKLKGYKKILYVCIALAVMYFLISYTDLFRALLEKTDTAVASGSITNGRSEIALSSFNANWKDGRVITKFLGIGYTELLAYNKVNIKMAIQAHNDIVTIYSIYGIIALIVYIKYLYRFMRGNDFIWKVLFLSVLILFNGLYLYESFVLCIIVVGVYFKYFSNVYQK